MNVTHKCVLIFAPYSLITLWSVIGIIVQYGVEYIKLVFLVILQCVTIAGQLKYGTVNVLCVVVVVACAYASSVNYLISLC